MPDFIINKSDFEEVAINQVPLPEGFTQKCRTKASIFRTLNSGKRADGILIRIINRANGKPDIRIFKYFKKQAFTNGFVVERGVLTDQMLRGAFIVLNIYIYTEPSHSIIIAGSDVRCGQEGGDAGEGVKVRIPT